MMNKSIRRRGGVTVTVAAHTGLQTKRFQPGRNRMLRGVRMLREDRMLGEGKMIDEVEMLGKVEMKSKVRIRTIILHSVNRRWTRCYP